MQSEYDFKGALDAYNGWLCDGDLLQPRLNVSALTNAEERLCDAGRAIKAALRIADRMQRGDVSAEMEGIARVFQEGSISPLLPFKAMAAQLLKEECDA